MQPPNYIKVNRQVYRLASTSEQEVEQLLLSVLPGSPFTGRAFAVGGYVRDEVMGLQSKDLDIVVEMPGGAEKFATYLHQQFPNETSNPYQIGKGYPIWHLAFKSNVQLGGKTYATEGAELDFADSQKEAFPDPESRQRVTQFGSLEEDTIRRDFTVNMLMKDLTTGKIVDPTGTGIDDVKRGVLRLHPEVNPDRPFSDDPLRMLRLIRFMAKYNWKADPAAIEAVKRNAHRIEIVSGERIMEELSKIMRLGKLAQAVRFMADTGLLKYVMPEVEALRGVKQSPQHHSEGDVFEHTMLVLEKAAPTISAQLSALLHDAGKPRTQKFLEDKIQFLGHEQVSGEIAEAMLRRLKFDLDTIKKVRRLVENHMRAHTSAEWGPAAVRKFIREIGEDVEDVLALTEIDALSSLGPGMVSKHNPIPELRERIKQTLEIPVSKKPILSGGEIMQTLGIKPGKEVGVATKWLQDKADELAAQNQVLTPEMAKQLLLEQFRRSASAQYLLYAGALYREVPTRARLTPRLLGIRPDFRAAVAKTWADAQAVVDYLMGKGVDPVVIGGIALQQHGYTRQTEDIDVLLSREDRDQLSDADLVEVGPDGERLTELPGVDVLYEGDYWDNPHPDLVRAPGTHLPTFEGLILLKLRADRSKDQGDLTELIKRVAIPKNLKKRVFRFVERHAPERLDDLEGQWTVAEVELMRSQSYKQR
jgi:poly(A) polymerase